MKINYGILEKILLSAKNILFPAIIFMIAAFSFFSTETFQLATNQTFHVLFFVCVLISVATLLFFNISRPVFFILCSVICYILINFLKIKYGTEYTTSTAYQNLITLAPLNFIIFSILPERQLLKKNNVYLLMILMLEYAFAETISQNNFILNFAYNPIIPLSGGAFFFFVGLAVFAFIKTVLRGKIMDYALFFADLNIFCGTYFSNSQTALSLFFFCAILSLTVSLGIDIYNRIYKDSLTGLDSRNSYIIQSKNFPLKYSVGIISIDSYENIGRNFGKHAQQNITQLIAKKITDIFSDENIYHYNNDEFVIIFKNLDKNETFEKLETIRRTIAGASFQYNSRRLPIKITISAAVSEKKRSDANSHEVLVRAHKILEKTRSFSHNVTSKA